MRAQGRSCARSTYFLAMAVFYAGSVQAGVFRVDASSGVDSGTCGTTLAPCKSIQQAVNRALSGDTILVAQGRYTHQAGIDPCVGDTGVVCIVNKELSIFGGFAPGEWVTSDPLANPTIIDGQSSLRGVLVKRSFPGAPPAMLRLEGFTIENGRIAGQGPTDPNAFGGGIAGLLANVVLRDLIVRDNQAVGADVNSGTGGLGVGGGVYISSSQDLPIQVTLERLSFTGNQALGGAGSDRGGFAEGGALFVSRGSLVAKHLIVENNAARAGGTTGSGSLVGRGADGIGGGVAILLGTSAVLEDLFASTNTVSGGTAVDVAGGAFGGGLYIEGASVEVNGCELISNQALGGVGDTGGIGAGGGVMTFDAQLLLERASVRGNLAKGGDGPTRRGSGSGGGGYFERTTGGVSVEVSNSVFAVNRVERGVGGGVVGGGGGAVLVLGNDVSLTHSTFSGNELESTPLVGQAVVVVPRMGSPSHADIHFSIVADHLSLANVAAIHAQPGGSVTLNGGLFADNAVDTNAGAPNSGVFTGLGSVLQASSAGFVSPGPPSFDYHLLKTSAAIDEAVGSLTMYDLDSTKRGANRDLGADEVCFAAATDVMLVGTVVTRSVVEEACRSITAGSYAVGQTGDVTFQAGSRVELGDGFRVAAGGTFRVIIALP